MEVSVLECFREHMHEEYHNKDDEVGEISILSNDYRFKIKEEHIL